MQCWVATVDTDQFAGERLYAHASLTVAAPGFAGSSGDPVVLVHDGGIFGLGRVSGWYDDTVTVAYTHRLLDEPVPASLPDGFVELTSSEYEAVAALVPSRYRIDADRSVFFVSLAFPIEASSRAEAAREFWSYVDKLGPQELPVYVWPRGDELSMQPFVLGAPTNLDPEEGDED